MGRKLYLLSVGQWDENFIHFQWVSGAKTLFTFIGSVGRKLYSLSVGQWGENFIHFQLVSGAKTLFTFSGSVGREMTKQKQKTF